MDESIPAGVAAASERAGDARPPSAHVGSLLAWIVSTTGARTAVEVGSAGGVSGLWIVSSLAGRGNLTSVEPDPHRHSLASQAYDEAGVDDRVRTILGDPETVLDRLTDGGYDLVLLQLDKTPSDGQITHATRLLRESGALIVRTAEQGRVDNTAEALRDSGAFTTVATLPVDGGLVLATRAPNAAEDE
ncbi:MAG: class I SAM-dependent methyltransferase [Nitriliruptorales bacterium]|nr:class I SAM-dependent methyltransferase [Nitriliruptorales bacterium]